MPAGGWDLRVGAGRYGPQEAEVPGRQQEGETPRVSGPRDQGAAAVGSVKGEASGLSVSWRG